jgi:Cu-Zn family superoxide dismutase
MRVPPALLVTAAAVCAGCAGMHSKPVTATAVIEARSGSTAVGSATLRESKDHERVLLHVELRGLAPNSVHGLHIHDKGDCSAPDASSAGPHFNPTGTTHGSLDSLVHHAGDLPSVQADGTGNVKADFIVRDVTLSPGATSIVGRSLVVHRDRDDFMTQPAGNSGPRIACGVIAAG